MKILFIPVNYNSYNELNDYLKSLCEALSKSKNTQVTICIADNSCDKQEIDIEKFSSINICVEQFPNLGYFGAALEIYNKQIKSSDFDYVIISNVDIKLDIDFFDKLALVNSNPQIGWIVPQIWSNEEQRDRNPKIITRYSRRHLDIIKLMWQFPTLHKLYRQTLYKRKKHYIPIPSKNIYAGHGSLIILTNNFTNIYPHLEYPVFLFGEELFLAELCHRVGLIVEYHPEIKVSDEEHISTSKMDSKFYCKCNLNAVNYILKEFYE
ncbi:MAG: glycosyltransferase family 2 protein [Muribaculum sp.]|nr:glycosyltransferase family 2 protein [Muribaculum sp.]